MVLSNARGLARFALSALVAPMIMYASSSAAVASGTPSSLLDAWLGFPAASDIVPPYAFIRADESAERLDGAREDLIAEFKRLRWRLDEGGYARYVAALDAWQAGIGQRDRSRVPGDWSPSYLLSHPNSRPPVERHVVLAEKLAVHLRRAAVARPDEPEVVEHVQDKDGRVEHPRVRVRVAAHDVDEVED